jgi:hypothetical protein
MKTTGQWDSNTGGSIYDERKIKSPKVSKNKKNTIIWIEESTSGKQIKDWENSIKQSLIEEAIYQIVVMKKRVILYGGKDKEPFDGEKMLGLGSIDKGYNKGLDDVINLLESLKGEK